MIQILPPVPGRDGKSKITREVFNLKGDGSWGEETGNSHQEPHRLCSHSDCPRVNHWEFRRSWKKSFLSRLVFEEWKHCPAYKDCRVLLWMGQKEQYTIKEKQTLINKLFSKTMSPDWWQFKLQDKPLPRRVPTPLPHIPHHRTANTGCKVLF